MSMNLNWLKQNLEEDCVIFDIGCANMDDTLKYKNLFENPKLYAFECNRSWKSQNIITAREHNINYFHAAVSDDDKQVVFYPSDTLNDESWPWSGSIFAPTESLLTDQWRWAESYTVNSISLNTFCKIHNVCPDFIHIDAQGAEYSIFKNLEEKNKPKIIWAEITEFTNYATGVTYEEFVLMMNGLGYDEKFKSNCDSLFTLKSFSTTDYF